MNLFNASPYPAGIPQPDVDIAAFAGSAPISLAPLSELEKAVNALAQRILPNLKGKIPEHLNKTPAEMVEQANKEMHNLYEWEYRICKEISEAIQKFD